ncbi:MAG: carbohydrate binding family 9 domain-containing protein, partial [Saprospiraceae bacterium]|nr:carbohydrate binding family 9 domain-containing protein [Saprospiraceae bacterium]
MKCIIFSALAFAAGALTNVVFAQNTENFAPPDSSPVVRAIKISTPLAVDGSLDEREWQEALSVSDFFRMEPKQGGTYEFKTEVKFLFDEKNLYVGVFCEDSLGQKGIRVQDFRRDFAFGENDIFYFQLDPQNLRRYCLSFQTTPLGTQRDLQNFDDTFTDNDWDALWLVRSRILENGWSAEFAIPFKSLRYQQPKKGELASWGLTMARLARRKYEITVFPPIPQSFSPYRMTYAARLEGLELPKPALNLRLNPYFLYNYENRTTNGAAPVVVSKPKIGGDAKWAINSQAVLDLTFNTDFAQADVDRAVNNLTRFNLFFPERRQFFLENSGVYAGADITNVKPFFSRTIGLADAQFNALPVPIDAGARFTDRNQNRTLAGLYVRQRGAEGQAAANFGVFRYLKNYGKQNNIGGMLTHRFDEAAYGLEANHNTTLSLDGFIRPKDDVTIQYIATASTDARSNSTGFAGSFYTGWFPNKWYLFYWTDFVSEKYQPGMGYIFANNTIRQQTGGYHIWRPKKENYFIRRYDPGVYFTYYQNMTDGAFQQADLYIFPVYLWFRDNSFVEISQTLTWQNIDFAFAPLNIAIPEGRYVYNRFRVQYNTDRSRKLSASAEAEFGKFYDGRLTTAIAGLRFAPTPRVALTLDYELNQAKSLGANASDKTVRLYSGGLRLALNPQLQGTV